MNIIILLLVIIAMAGSFHLGSVYGTKHTAHVWTDYIMDHCVRLDMLLTRIQLEFEAAKDKAPEGMPVVIAQDTLLRIISETVQKQNQGR